MTGAEIFDRRFHTGFCTCGGIVARVPVGRPPRADKAATERIEIRVTRLERAAWEHAAAQVGISASEWIRRCCATEIRPLKEFPP